MRRILLAVALATVFVLAVDRLNHTGFPHPLIVGTFIILLPGIIVGCMSPDAACTAGGDLHPPGILAVILIRVANVVLYGWVIWLLLGRAKRLK